MADDIDIANDLIDSEVSRALNKMRQEALQDTKVTNNCIECGYQIEEPRQKLRLKRCFSCAEEAERRR